MGDTALSDLSDSDFVATLREGMEDRSWPMKHWIELGRRGMHILDADPLLKEAVDRENEAFKERMQEVSTMLDEANSREFAKIKDRIAEASLSFPKIDFPKLPDLSKVAGLPDRLPALDPTKVPALPVSPTLEMQVAQLEALSQIQEEIRQSRRLGWSYWLMFTITAIAALAAVTSVVIALR